jgi:hypothetical protein
MAITPCLSNNGQVLAQLMQALDQLAGKSTQKGQFLSACCLPLLHLEGTNPKDARAD